MSACKSINYISVCGCILVQDASVHGRCVSIGERGPPLYQYAPFTDCIYLFIYFSQKRKKKCESVRVFVYSKKPILSLDSNLR